MATVAIPRQEWDHHPAGQHEGFFFAVEEPREFETQWGPKVKLPLKIESSTSFRDDGQPYIITIWDTVSSAPNSNLRQHREKVLGRELTADESKATEFDPVEEFVAVRIGYVVAHRPKADGSGDITSFIETFWRLEDQGEKPESKQNRYDDIPLKPEKSSAAKEQLDKLFGPTEEVTEEELAKEEPKKKSSTPTKADLIKQAIHAEKVIELEEAHVPKCRMKFIETENLESATVAQLKEYITQVKGLAPPGTDFSFENDDLPF